MAESGSPGRLPSKQSLTAIIMMLVIVFIVILVPRQKSIVTTVDGQHQWAETESPPRREVVWQPAEPIAVSDQAESASLIRPFRVGSDDTLYFSLRTKDRGLEIARSTRTTDGWSKPEPIEALNSKFDDIGPAISADGSALYLYSDRPGGFGGTDLYLSHRDGNSWSTPVNLGPQLNSPADEFDPTISPDGLRICFSSNRSRQMHRQLAEGTFDPETDHWPTTLRSDRRRATFDLYAAELDIETEDWARAQPMQWLNTGQHNEGAAFISSDGAFIYFASDQPNRSGGRRNFDIYRARIDRPEIPPENLGPGINSAANEIEPFVAESGFELLFSRSDFERADYGLYRSTAKEVYSEQQWDQSHLHSLGGSIATAVQHLWQRLWLILLLAAAIAALIWLLRQIALRRIALPGFLLAALILHLLLVTGSFFVYFQQHLAKKLRELFDEDVVATQVLLSPAHAASEAQRSLQAASAMDMPAPVQPIHQDRKQVAEPAPAEPIEYAKPIAVAKNQLSPADVNVEPVVASVPVPAQKKTSRDPLRRAEVSFQQASESIPMMETAAAEPSKMQNVPRQQPAARREQVEPVNVQPDAVAVNELETTQQQPPTEEITPALTTPEMLKVEQAPREIELTRTQMDGTLEAKLNADPAVPTEEVAAVQRAEIEAPASEQAEFRRAADPAILTIPQPEPLLPSQPSDSLPPLVRSEIELQAIRADHQDAAKHVASTASPLLRSRRTSAAASAAQVQTEEIAMVAGQAPAASPKSPDVGAQRREQTPSPVAVESLAAPPQPADSTPLRLAGKQISPLRPQQALTAARDPLKKMVRRQSARSFADVKVNLQSLLRRRNLDEDTKREVVEQFGGNDQTLQAIRRGLHWLAQHQRDDGSWSLNRFSQQCKDHKKCSGHGSSRSDSAGTALALLPFLGDGNTHQAGPYQKNVQRGIQWLLKHQNKDGNLFTGGEGNALMYSHGIATIALCECYGMTGDAALRQPAQRAIDFIVAAQDAKSGGWRYRPRQHGDTSVVGWQVMALKSGQMADLHIPEKSLSEAQRWLESVAGTKNRLGQFAYQRNKNFNPAMTAEALLCWEYLDNDRQGEQLVRGADFLLANLPKKNRETSYYWYYGTQAMFHLQGEHWQRWNEAIHPLLVETQHQEGPMTGTWDPRDQWERSGGRVYATSLRILMLEVYYRHLPLYQVIQ